MTKQRYARFWSRRSIVSLIGIDYPILEKSEHDNWSKFYLAGFLVLGILVISFCSVFYAFDLMFDMWHAEILLSSFFSLMFFTIYIFLIQTFSKEVFPTAIKFKFFNLSNLSRVAFVLMIGFLIAQPVKIFVVKDRLDNDLSIYKTQLYQRFCNVNAGLYSTDINKLLNEKSKYQLMPKSSTLDAEMNKISVAIVKIDSQINAANLKAKESISRSNFFIKRIELSRKYPLTTVVIFLVVALFFTPILLIYSISRTSKYYQLKRNYERHLVLAEYSNFKSRYAKLFKEKYEKNDISFHEPFLDPPFNTVRKPLPDYLTQEDFFNNLIG